jgi:hypothetical protein
VNSTPTTLCSVVPEDNSIPLLTPPSTPNHVLFSLLTVLKQV